MKGKDFDYCEIEFNDMKIHILKIRWDKLTQENKDAIMDFDTYRYDIGKGNGVRVEDIRILIRFGIDITKPFSSVTKDDVNRWFRKLRVKRNTKIHYGRSLSKFYRWQLKLPKNKTPKILEDINQIKPEDTTKKASEMITEEEFQKLLEFYREPGEKALIALLFDSSCRRGEIAGAKIKDLYEIGGQFYISVEGKTGIRSVPLTFSVIYLLDWINIYHPFKDKKDAPLFIARSNRLKFKPYQQRGISADAIWRIVKKGEKFLDKHLHPHLFRHSRLTILGQEGLVESVMRDYAGWTKTSHMPSVYVHPNKEAMVNKIREIDGLPPLEKTNKRTSLLKPIICPRCGAENINTSSYCKQCYLPLKLKVSMHELKIIEMIRSLDSGEISQLYPKWLEEKDINLPAKSELEIFKILAKSQSL